ncbi:MAG: mycofactocin system FadH/OYE family oxidoreductase 1 [Acidimicrobiales bacterium]
MTALGDPLKLGRATAPNRFVFGPHETNLGRRRSLSDRHVAYYAARAAGGSGVIITEEASVHCSDWPYERAPLASECGEGWQKIAASCHDLGALVIAALGHAGGQGSSAYHQQALWAPSRVPDVATREVPKAMEQSDIDAVVAGFSSSAALAAQAGCDGVEINAGQWSLLRQFASGLTNNRSDGYGTDRFRLLREVLQGVREEVPHSVLGLRLSCDELAPWAGLVPDAAVAALEELVFATGGVSTLFDYVTVVRGSAYGTSATRPDGQVPPAFNREITGQVRRALPPGVAVIAQGSIVDVAVAETIVAERQADGVEMTRAQIADSAMAGKLLSGRASTVRPCVLCNQMCQVRDVRNPLVSCIGEPRSGHETEDRLPEGHRSQEAGQHVLVVGGGPAGLECARVAATAGCRVTVLERRGAFGGMVAAAAARAPGRQRLALLVSWLERECRRLGVVLEASHEATLEELDSHDGPISLCTGSKPGRRSYQVVAPGTVVAAADVLSAERLPGEIGPAATVVWDPVGGPVGVGVAELLARIGSRVTLVTPDFVAGEQLARTGDLAPANVRLARCGVEIVRHAVVKAVEAEGVTIEDRFSARRRVISDALLVDAGHRLGDDSLYRSLAAGAGGSGPMVLLAGDAVAPRSIHEAVLEGRRAGLLVSGDELRHRAGSVFLLPTAAR